MSALESVPPTALNFGTTPALKCRLRSSKCFSTQAHVNFGFPTRVARHTVVPLTTDIKILALSNVSKTP